MNQSTLAAFLNHAVALMAAGIGQFPVPQLGNLTATAILGWYAWHTACKTIPALVKNFRDEMAAARDEFRTERDAFRQEMLLERQFRHDDNTAIVIALNDLSRKLPAALKPTEVIDSDRPPEREHN